MGKDIVRLVVSIVVCQLAGFIGSLFTRSSIPTWYASVRKPSFNPPNWIFGPVWTTLYLLMGIAAFLVWRQGLDNKAVRLALLLFIIQLVLNTLWSIIFFGMRSLSGGFADIAALWIMIVLTTVSFFRLSAVAGVLMVPYLLWVTFASVLNFAIWRLNS